MNLIVQACDYMYTVWSSLHIHRTGTTDAGGSDYTYMSGTTDKLKAGSISFGPNAAYGQHTIGVHTDANTAYEQHTIDQPVPEALYEHLK